MGETRITYTILIKKHMSKCQFGRPLVRCWEHIKMKLRERYLKLYMPGRGHRGKYHKQRNTSKTNFFNSRR
jgi:hypothetical protein